MPAPPGLQRERTALAWQRTGVAGTALAASVLVAAVRLAGPAVVTVAALAVGLSAGAVAVAARSARPGRRGDSPWERLLAVAAVPAVLGAVGVLLAVAG